MAEEMARRGNEDPLVIEIRQDWAKIDQKPKLQGLLLRRLQEALREFPRPRPLTRLPEVMAKRLAAAPVAGSARP
jgi:hypothetical protein